MKKLFAVLAVALFVNLTVAKAQSTAAPAAADQKKETVAKDTKQCGSTASYQHSCGGAKASTTSSTTLSENHVNAGSATTVENKDAKASCSGKESKACCKGGSKASALTKANTGKAVAPKEAAVPQQ